MVEHCFSPSDYTAGPPVLLAYSLQTNRDPKFGLEIKYRVPQKVIYPGPTSFTRGSSTDLTDSKYLQHQPVGTGGIRKDTLAAEERATGQGLGVRQA